MIKSVFIIIPSKNNDCIFYGQIDERDEIDDLGSILGTIVDFAQKLNEGEIKSIQLNQGKFAYGLLDKIYLIFKIQLSDDFEKIKIILKNTAEGFLSKYKDELDKYSGDASLFEDFSKEINEFLGEFSSIKEEVTKNEMKPIKKEKTTNSTIKKEKEEINLQEMKDIIITPINRDSYPNGIDEYMRDEVLWNESQSVMKDYTAEFVEGVIAKIEIYLSISIVHHYEINIDFQNYPEKPIIDSSVDLKEKSYFLKNWDNKIPPHIIELVREFEKILLNMKNDGILEPTSDMPATIIPDLEPLEKLPPLPEKDNKNKLKENDLQQENKQDE